MQQFLTTFMRVGVFLLMLVLWALFPELLLVLLTLLVIHEFGHYWVGKRFGAVPLHMRIGIGPVIFGWTRGYCRFEIHCLPLLGSVRFLGGSLNPEDNRAEARALAYSHPFEDPKIFGPSHWIRSLPQSKQILIFAGGVLFNFATAVIALFGLTAVVGTRSVIGPHGIEIEHPTDLAEDLGVMPGDRILEVAGCEPYSFEQLSTSISMALSSSGSILVLRDGTLESLVVPQSNEFSPPEQRRLERFEESTYCLPQIAHTRANSTWWVSSANQTAEILSQVVSAVPQILIGKFRPSDFGLNYLLGSSAQIVDLSPIARMIEDFLLLLAVWSIIIGAINLLPVPPLDGGRMAIATVELFGLKLSAEKELAACQAGYFLLFAYQLFLIWTD